MSTSYRTKRFITSLIRLTRVWNLLIIALSQYFIAATLVDNQAIWDWRLFVLSLSTVLIAAAGYIINDYYDIKIDLVNKPDRVIIGKGITRRYAILLHTLLSVIGVLLGLVLNWRIGAINFASAFLLWWYSNDLKRQPFIGNVVVALMTGISIIIVDAIYQTGNILIIIYATFAFFITLVREIIKDMEDLKGDHTFGCKTLPIVWGLRKTKQMIYGIIVVFSLIAFLLSLFLSKLPEYYFLTFLFPPLVFLVIRLVKADTKKDFAWLSSFCKVIMLLGILSLAFVRM
ncbi:geranylgeranylglycerol-phosphate geranylgeranyltransferase [Chryseosolibacter indicus]|uniref:Geranylgeranylglycerol-phosphate geranylgeranyltransferase n=1 Tax=Chryseosolibacter indicus TaxID=2782351 RepID=A0ABS5VQ82_9BACT|nr:geranylgeranylglycerol-phosphate geranylgeranyltransferase [Chryseosolibacter indicus]MBT1703010.1 geranylgeranylglycerol-phosphate geranylgeranyltransferase [Chryseosolibacter indicus]